MSVHSYTVEKISGQKVSLEKYRGKVMLIVNTATACTFTPQLDDLQQLYAKYNGYGLEVLGFPCNQFGKQAQGTNEQLASFCQLNYGVKFPMFAKVDVNGEAAHPLFLHLQRAQGYVPFEATTSEVKLSRMMLADEHPEWLHGDEIKWNFTKFLVDGDGQVLARFEPHVTKQQLEEAVVAALSVGV